MHAHGYTLAHKYMHTHKCTHTLIHTPRDGNRSMLRKVVMAKRRRRLRLESLFLSCRILPKMERHQFKAIISTISANVSLPISPPSPRPLELSLSLSARTNLKNKHH